MSIGQLVKTVAIFLTILAIGVATCASVKALGSAIDSMGGVVTHGVAL